MMLKQHPSDFFFNSRSKQICADFLKCFVAYLGGEQPLDFDQLIE